MADSETNYLIREKNIQAIIQRAIDRISEKMREIYELKRNQYLTVKQIAEELDLSEHTVSTQLKRAQKHLRLKLGVVVYVLFLLHGSNYLRKARLMIVNPFRVGIFALYQINIYQSKQQEKNRNDWRFYF